jgi:Sulfatase-modifying factor enzyme 1
VTLELLPLVPLLVALAPLPSALPPALQLDAAALASVGVVAQLPEACPGDMALVDGNVCPSLEYQCDRFVDESSPSCAEYAHKPECRFNQESARFCVDRYEWPNQVGEKPTVFVTWYQAKKACQSVGKRLCERSEWTLACEGPKRTPFPYGFERFPSPCNVSRPVEEADPKKLQSPATRNAEIERLWQADPIGSHPDCVSAFGAFDMVGNVDEWTDNGEEGGAQVSTLNGGYWGPVRNTCRLTTKTHGPDFQFYQIGFRCCADPRDGISAARPPDPQSKAALDARKGPEGWPVPVSEDHHGDGSEPSG